MDKGPWKPFYRGAGELAGLLSDDFEHDVVLYVNGDFSGPEQFKSYCEWLAGKLNATQPAEPK